VPKGRSTFEEEKEDAKMTKQFLFESDSQQESSDEPPDWAQPQSEKRSPSLRIHAKNDLSETNGHKSPLLTFLFTLLAFFIGWSTTLAWRATDGIFMAKVGVDALTDVYCIASCFMIVIGTVLIKYMNSLSAHKLLKTVLLLGLALFGALLMGLNMIEEHEVTTFWFAAKTANQIFSVFAASAFWLFYDQHFLKRYSNSHYALLCCATFVGYGCAGVLIHWNQGDAQSTFICQALLLLSSIVCASAISRCAPKRSESANLIGFSDQSSLRDYFKSLKKSPIALILAGATLLLFILSATAEYAYLYVFEDYYQSTSTAWVEARSGSEMAKTLGTCCALVGVGNLITALFLSCRCFMPIKFLAWLAPIFAGALFLFYQQDSMLLYPAIGMLIVDGLYPLIEENNVNGLVGTVPSKLKQKVRLLIETFSEPVGMLFSSILIASTSMSPASLLYIVGALILAVCFSLWIERLRKSRLPLQLKAAAPALPDYDALKVG